MQPLVCRFRLGRALGESALTLLMVVVGLLWSDSLASPQGTAASVAGGSVVLSSHVMALVERMCDHVAVVAGGRVLAAGTLDDVRTGADLEDRFVGLVGSSTPHRELAWLRPSSD